MTNRERLTLFLALALICVGSVSAEDDPLVRGARLAKERCAKCHGLGGLGKDPEYPSIAGQHEEYFTKQIFNFKTGQRFNEAMMPVLEKLLAADVRALSLHFSGLPPGSVPSSDVALLSEGRGIYFDGISGAPGSACVVCHGQNAIGGVQLPRLAGQNPVYLERQLRGFIQKTRHNDRMMHLSLSAMSERQLKAVTVYLGNEK